MQAEAQGTGSNRDSKCVNHGSWSGHWGCAVGLGLPGPRQLFTTQCCGCTTEARFLGGAGHWRFCCPWKLLIKAEFTTCKTMTG